MNNKSIVLTFHGIGDFHKKLEKGEEKVWINKYHFLEFCKFAVNNDDITITFDDGNMSDFEIGLPALVENNLKAIFFIVTDRIGKDNYLNSNHIITLKQHGMTIGLHGMYHRSWRGLSDKELDVELLDAKKKIEDIIDENIYFASCPFGTYNGEILKKIKSYGYRHLFTSDGGMNNLDDYIQHRNTVHYNENVNILLQNIKKYKTNIIKTLWRDFKCYIKIKYWYF